jgi:hypothetical protein
MMAKDFKMTVGSHFVRLTEFTQRGKQAVVSFSQRFIEYGLRPAGRGQFAREATRVFRGRTEDHQEYRFHRHNLTEFLEFIKHHQITKDYYTEEILPPYPEAPVELVVQDGWEDYDYQIPAIAFIQMPGLVNRLLKLGTGKGKSYCMCRAIGEKGVRSIFIIRPSFIEKWLIDIRRVFHVTVDDVFVIKKASELKSVISRALAGEEFTFKIMLISNVLIQNWIKEYEKYRDGISLLGWDCAPHELYQVLKIGFRVVDEVHMDFHRNFKIDLHTHVNHAASMSATLESDDPFRNRMYEVAYPRTGHHGDGSIDKYIIAIGLLYEIRDPEKIVKAVSRNGMYSHFPFEEQILKDKRLTKAFLQMTMDMVDAYYLEEDYYKSGDKCVVYVSSIDMADYLTAQYKAKYYEYDVRRYVENDPYENLMDGDIVITNLQKAGTNVDIPRLTTVCMWTAVDSRQSNIQGAGRLRALKDGRQPRFVWGSCINIPKHMEYHGRKMGLLKNRTGSLRDMRYNRTIG